MSAPTPGWVTWAGLAVVVGAAAVLSFSGLRDLAVMCRVPETLAPLLPVCVDAGAAVATRVWLSGRSAPAAQRFARALTWSLLASTVAGNAIHQGLASAALAAPWWLAVVVGAVPPAVVGATVHLAVLVGRPVPAVGVGPETAPGDDARMLKIESLERLDLADVGGSGLSPLWDDAPPAGDPAPDRVAELIAAGAGRRRLARELHITESEARRLLDAARNGDGEVTR